MRGELTAILDGAKDAVTSAWNEALAAANAEGMSPEELFGFCAQMTSATVRLMGMIAASVRKPEIADAVSTNDRLTVDLHPADVLYGALVAAMLPFKGENSLEWADDALKELIGKRWEQCPHSVIVPLRGEGAHSSEACH